MDFIQMTSPCGMDCFNCPAYLANDNINLRMNLSEKLNLHLENAKCQGCRKEKGIIAFLGDKKPCKVFNCSTEKGITYCYECMDFPCDSLHPYADKANSRPHNTKMFNLCLIKKMGVNQWAKDKAANVRNNYFNGTLRVHATDGKE